MKRSPGLLAIIVLSLLSGLNSFSAVAEVATNEPASGAAAVSISTNAAEVIRLLETGVEETVVLAFVENSPTPFALAADDIIYLKDVGVSSEIITAMLHRDAVLHEQARGEQPSPTLAAGALAPSVQAITPIPSSNQPTTQVVYVTNAPTEVSYFYEPLAPYGTWIAIDNRWYWQPHVVVVDHSWRPYCHGGRWIYSDYGWYWHSDYTWGWAPFHYGRWHHHDHHGWVWYPDLVWAPAWVSWRFSDMYCGWAPLPPGAHFVIGHGWYFNNISVGIDFDFHLGWDWFTYVEHRHFHDHRLHMHRISPTHSKDIHVHSKVVNNYTVGDNQRIINHGIAVDKVVAATGREIQPARITETPIARGHAIKGDRVEKVGTSTVIYRPELRAPIQGRPPTAQKVDDRPAIVRRTPERPAVSAPPRTSVKPVPPAAGARARTPPPSRPQAPSVTPPVRRVEPAPVPGIAPPRYTQPAVPRPSPQPPARQETPKGREQRLSNGTLLHRSQPPPSRPPSGRPPAQKGSERRSGRS